MGTDMGGPEFPSALRLKHDSDGVFTPEFIRPTSKADDVHVHTTFSWLQHSSG